MMVAIREALASLDGPLHESESGLDHAVVLERLFSKPWSATRANLARAWCALTSS
jgi:hypothetical protein